MPWPSTISSFSYPQPTDRLNNPSHSALENSQSSAIGQIQTFLGTSSSAVGTLIYDVRSSASNGGGHVQTANKGGTGQTSYTKGDILVATSSSVLAKLAVSSTIGEYLQADPNQSSGMKWGIVPTNKVAINVSSVVVSGTDEQVLYSASVLGSTLGTTNAIKFTGAISNFGMNNDFTLRLKYGNNTISTATITATNLASVFTGKIEGFVANNSASSQDGYFLMHATANKMSGSATTFHAYAKGTSSVNSSANQNLIITANYNGTSGVSSITTGMFVVEKIS